jgi:hypothetical protein
VALAEGARPPARPAARRPFGRLAARRGRGGLQALWPRAPVEEGDRRERYRATIKARIDWEPTEPNYHLFAVDVDSAGFVTFREGNRFWMAWDGERGLRRGDQRES